MINYDSTKAYLASRNKSRRVKCLIIVLASSGKSIIGRPAGHQPRNSIDYSEGSNNNKMKIFIFQLSVHTTYHQTQAHHTYIPVNDVIK